MLLPHRLVLRSSHFLATAIALIHTAALSALVPLPMPLWLKLGLAAMIVGSACVSTYRHALLCGESSVREMVLMADGTVECERKDGGRFTAKVSLQTTVLPWLIVILLYMPGERGSSPLVIMADSLPAKERRVLCAWLRWKIT